MSDFDQNGQSRLFIVFFIQELPLESCAHNTSCICMHYHDNQLMSEVNPIKSFSPWAAHLLMPEEIIKSGLLQPTEIAAELEFLFVVTENMSLEDSFVHKTIAVGADLVSN